MDRALASAFVVESQFSLDRSEAMPVAVTAGSNKVIRGQMARLKARVCAESTTTALGEFPSAD
jgi:hypothetical protein